ncbi:BREX system serine/threonine kinase PglW [Kitasatospora sp. NPDC001664]
MRADSPRWHEVSESEFPHERAGLAHVRELLPDRAPFHAWSNFEFRDRQGKWHEVDLLVLGEGRLHLVELKHYRGTITGNAYTWQRNRRSEDSPLPQVRRKAQRLSSLIKDALRDLAPQLDGREVPYIQESIFLHAPDGRCDLAPGDRTDLFGLDGQQSRSGLPSIADRLLEPLGARRKPKLIEHDDLLPALFERIGFARRREHQVGSWRLVGQPDSEGADWQEWPAEHRIAHDPARIRFMVTPPGASEEQRQATRQLIEREYALTRRLQHDGLLLPRDLVEDEIGVGLVFPDDREAQRLDLWLDDQQGSASINAQVSVIRQLAEVLAYAHRNHVVHRGLTPAAVQVRTTLSEVKVRLGGWQVAGRDDPSTATRPSHGAATRIMRALEEGSSDDPERRHAEAYLAPEGRWDPAADRIRLDVFALGAVAYHLVAGQPPATDIADLRERLNRDGGLDLTVDVPGVPGSLRRLVLEATRPVVSKRLRDMQAFLALLDDVDREVSSPGAGADGDPLEAAPGTLIGRRFELLRRLGSGSTAVGLLVADRDNGDERRVLKVARDDAAARRLADEAEVLRTLRRIDHPRIVRLVDEQTLRVGRRTALLLESAGDETLADALRERTRLSLDLLDRWGTDLLEALVGLDRAAVDHRDIKPANLGIREQRSDRAKHLVLFDFSLSRAGAASIEAGTPPYLDPFLGTHLRPNWDSAAERYAAAVTLYEMATGRAPVYGDGLSDPSVIRDEVTLAPGAFDPSLTDQLTDFFRTALSRDFRQRHHTAAEMLTAWRAVFTSTDTAPPADADARAAAAEPEMSLSEAGLSARALSALEPLGLATVADLALADPGKLSRLVGVADVTRREVRSRAKQWRERFAAELTTGAVPSAAMRDVDDPLADPAYTAEVLVQAAGSARATGRRRAARVLLGLVSGAEAFATRVEFAAACGLAGAPQASNVLSTVQEAWADSPAVRSHLDGVLARATEALTVLGGIATADDVVDILVATSVDTGQPEDETPTAAQHRIVAGLLVAALERAEVVERGGGNASPVSRRRRRGGRSVLLATDPALLEAADALGSAADELVAAATAAGDHVVPVGRAATRLRQLWPQGVSAPDDTRLAKIAARLSAHAQASRRGELHDRDLDAAVALRIALGGLAPSQKLTAADVKRRVQARFPELTPLPNRPRLDQIIAESKLPLSWDGEAYTIPSRRADSTSLASRTMFAPRSISLAQRTDGTATREDAQLAQSVAGRSFLALGAPSGGLDAIADALVSKYGAVTVNVTAVLVAALQSKAQEAGIPWELVKAADAAAPNSRDAQGLAALVRQASPAVERAIAEAVAGAAEGTRPVLLVEAAPLARYGQLDIVARLADITIRRSQAIWLLLPLDTDRAAVIDRAPVPLTHGGQFLCLDDWLSAPVPEGDSA